ncbi:Zn-ribbon domain-containing OB-fold protein [Williamsia maris]|uniref:Zn-ribbon domain-containing OB-fold protein n=1 Tax=Williamsia maris TaxID=72806 RepID=UPI0020A3BC0B|nr:OB-fold nucleic acid binding domain-containing protein [Williamsia maris]
MSNSQTSPGFAAVLDAAVADVPEPASPVLTAPLSNTFDYTRSLGPVLSRFAEGLLEGAVVGGRASDGRVFVPPPEFDPVSGAPITDFVEVGPTGTVSTWSWQPEPLPGQPLSEPFAWALITFDGADTALLHVVQAASAEELNTGLRVHPVWKSERTGRIDDIAHFVAGENPEPAQENTGAGQVTPGMIVTPIGLTIDHSATVEETWYLEGIKEGKLIGGRTSDGVYFPPRVSSPANGDPTTEKVELPDTGIITTFCIVNVPFLGQQIKPPYVAAYVLLDGSDIGFLHLILDVEAADVRMGMRVQAVWRDRSEWDHTLRNISHFRPTGEPDAEYESYKKHL